MGTLLTPTGHEVLVDDDLKLPGSVSMSGNGYAKVTVPGGSIPLHQWIMGTYGFGHSVAVDHINRNKLDNRRENLRVVDRTISNVNTKERERKEVLPRNVYRHKGGYIAQVSRYGERRYLGRFGTPGLAAQAVADFKKEYDA